MPLDQELDRVVQGAQPGASGGFHVPEVETGEKLEDLGGIDGIAGGGREQGLVEAAQFGGESGALALGESGGGARAEPFDGADEFEELAGVLKGERSDTHAASLLALDRDVSLAGQEPERAADRGPAEPEPLGELGLDQACARRQAPGDDQLTELCVRGRDTLSGHDGPGESVLHTNAAEEGYCVAGAERKENSNVHPGRAFARARRRRRGPQRTAGRQVSRRPPATPAADTG